MHGFTFLAAFAGRVVLRIPVQAAAGAIVLGTDFFGVADGVGLSGLAYVAYAFTVLGAGLIVAATIGAIALIFALTIMAIIATIDGTNVPPDFGTGIKIPNLF